MHNDQQNQICLRTNSPLQIRNTLLDSTIVHNGHASQIENQMHKLIISAYQSCLNVLQGMLPESVNMPPPPALRSSFKLFTLTSPKISPVHITSRSPVKHQHASAAATKPLCIAADTLHGTAQAKTPTAAARIPDNIAGRMGSTGNAKARKPTGNGSSTGRRSESSSTGRKTQHAGSLTGREGSPNGRTPDPEGRTPDPKGGPAGKTSEHDGKMKSKGATSGSPMEVATHSGSSSNPDSKPNDESMTDEQLARSISPQAKLGINRSLKAKCDSGSSSAGRLGSKGIQAAEHGTGHSPTGRTCMETSSKGNLVGTSPTDQGVSQCLPLGKPEPAAIPTFPHRPMGSLEGSPKGNTDACSIGKARSGCQSPVHKRHCSRWEQRPTDMQLAVQRDPTMGPPISHDPPNHAATTMGGSEQTGQTPVMSHSITHPLLEEATNDISHQCIIPTSGAHQTTPEASKHVTNADVIAPKMLSNNSSRSGSKKSSSHLTSSSDRRRSCKRQHHSSNTDRCYDRLRRTRSNLSIRFRGSYSDTRSRSRNSSSTISHTSNSSVTSNSRMKTSSSNVSSDASSYSSGGTLAAAYGIDASDTDVTSLYGCLNWYVKRPQSGDLPCVSNNDLQVCYSWCDKSPIRDRVSVTAWICATDVMSWHWSQSGGPSPWAKSVL